MTQTTFAIIGTGVVGERIISQILNHSSSKIVAIFDENKNRLHEIAAKYQLPASDSMNDLLATKPDWVYIGTPPVSHAPLAEQIAAHGLNILSEKPLAHDEEDGKRMVKVANEASIQTAMHFPLMYSPVVHLLKSYLDKAALGDIVRVELHTYFPHWPRKWQQNPWIGTREQGGFIREVFPHYLQLLYRFFGELTIHSHHTSYPEDKELCETGVTALAKTEGGIPILLNGLSGIGQEEKLEFKVFGTEKVATIHNWSELWVSETDQESSQLFPEDHSSNLISACCETLAGNESIIVPFEEGLLVQQWIDKLLQSN